MSHPPLNLTSETFCAEGFAYEEIYPVSTTIKILPDDATALLDAVALEGYFKDREITVTFDALDADGNVVTQISSDKPLNELTDYAYVSLNAATIGDYSVAVDTESRVKLAKAVTVDGVKIGAEDDNTIVLGIENNDGTYSLPENVLGYCFEEFFVDAGRYVVEGGEVITTVSFNVKMVDGAQVRYGAGLDEDGKINTGNGLRFLATVNRNGEPEGAVYGMKITAEGSSAETLIDAENWQDENNTLFSVAITDMAVSNYNREFTATPYVKVKYADGTEKTIYGTETVKRSIYCVAAGLLKTGDNGGVEDDSYGVGTSYGLYDVLNAYVNMVGVRLNMSGDGKFTASDKYTGDVFFDVTSVDKGNGVYEITITPITVEDGFAYPVEIMSYWEDFVRINNNNSVVKNCITDVNYNDDGGVTFTFTMPE